MFVLLAISRSVTQSTGWSINGLQTCTLNEQYVLKHQTHGNTEESVLVIHDCEIT